jgi:hypothetical protein
VINLGGVLWAGVNDRRDFQNVRSCLGYIWIAAKHGRGLVLRQSGLGASQRNGRMFHVDRGFDLFHAGSLG